MKTFTFVDANANTKGSMIALCGRFSGELKNKYFSYVSTKTCCRYPLEAEKQEKYDYFLVEHMHFHGKIRQIFTQFIFQFRAMLNYAHQLLPH